MLIFEIFGELAFYKEAPRAEKCSDFPLIMKTIANIITLEFLVPSLVFTCLCGALQIPRVIY